MSFMLKEVLSCCYCLGFKTCPLCVATAPHLYVQFISVSHSVMSNSLQPHGLQHPRFPCPSPTPRAYSNSCPSSQWCHLCISVTITLLSCMLSKVTVTYNTMIFWNIAFWKSVYFGSIYPCHLSKLSLEFLVLLSSQHGLCPQQLSFRVGLCLSEKAYLWYIQVMPKGLGCYGLIFLPQGASLALYLFIYFNISETWSLPVLFIVLQTVLDTFEMKFLSVTPGFHELYGPSVFSFLFSATTGLQLTQHGSDALEWFGHTFPLRGS